jgi:hypothetical protein
MRTTRAKTAKTPALEKPKRLLALFDHVKETEFKAQCWGPALFGLLVTDKKFIFCSKLKSVKSLPMM